MIELNSSVHTRYAGAARGAARACATRSCRTAGRLNLARRRRRLAPVPRLGRPAHLSDTSASSTSRALRLPRQAVHGVRPAHPHRLRRAATTRCTSPTSLTRYMPHFIALSAASPFYQGEDTSFQSSRLHAVIAFPLAGHMPFVRDWAEFIELLRRDEGLRHRREHEGLLLGHPPQARVRHDRDPRLRHAAHGGARRAARGLRADARRLPSARARRTQPSRRSTASTATTASRPAASASRRHWSTRTPAARRKIGEDILAHRWRDRARTPRAWAAASCWRSLPRAVRSGRFRRRLAARAPRRAGLARRRGAGGLRAAWRRQGRAEARNTLRGADCSRIATAFKSRRGVKKKQRAPADHRSP